MDNKCPFCKIHTENRILKEGKFAYVIFSNPRLMPGHLLVIPKRHIENGLNELTTEEREEIFSLLTEFQTKILAKLTPGCDIRNNLKPYKNESRTHLKHMHFHLLPRTEGDKIGEVEAGRTAIYENMTDQEKQNIINLLNN